MNTTTDNKSRLLLDIIECIYCAGNIYDIANVLFSKLDILINFRSASMWMVDEDSWELADVIDYRCNSATVRKHKKRIMAENRLFTDNQWPEKINDSSISLAGETKLHERSINNDCSCHTLSVICGLNEQPISVIHLYRQAEDNPFEDEDTNLINRIAVHVAQAIVLESGVTQVDQFLAPGVLVFSDDRQLLFRNQRSKEVAPGYQPEELLAMALKPNLYTDKNTCCHLRAFNTKPHSLLHWIRNPKVSDSIGNQKDKERYNTVVVARPFLLRHIIEKRLHQSQLSPREFDVALNAIQGLSNAQIASKLCIDETTVKDHLHRIYNKMSVRSRTAMVSRVLNLDRELAGLTGQQKEIYLREVTS